MKYTREYYLKEAEYCRKEEQDFYENRTEENRQKVLQKREEFRLLNNLPYNNNSICDND